MLRRWFTSAGFVLALLPPTLVFAATSGQPEKVVTTPTQEINLRIREHWLDNGIRPAKSETDGKWARRVFLDLLGRIPTLGELRAFERASRSDKRQKLVDSLLYDARYTDEFAGNWSTIWTNLLIGRTGGNERNSLIDREGMQQYLRDVFARNRSYDSMVMDLITAEGANKPGMADFNGAVNFLSMKLADKGIQATADTARIFLGKQVQCTQCHDHPFNEWKQNQFWELNSFFRQAVSLRRFDKDSGMVSYVELSDQDFGGEGNTPDNAEVYYELRDATLKAAYPRFIDGGETSSRSGRLSDIHRRKELANFILGSDELSRALVNRVWAHFFSYGFTKPVDDMGPHNPVTHPELLDYLANAFKANSYDLRLLMRWIATSEPYSLTSRITKRNELDDPAKGQRPLFSHFYARQMRAEELHDSLLVATGADRIDNGNGTDGERRDWLKQFVVAFGNDEALEGSTFNGTITQSLVLFNGDLTKKALSDERSGLLYRLAVSDQPIEKKVDHLFLVTLARRATKAEQQAAKQLLLLRGGSLLEALQDVLWALLNSNEFILNH